MSMIDIHSAALDSKIASYHEFLARYSRRSRVVYGFVEGKEDPSFYRGFIELLIPQEWEVELWAAGNKDQVYRIHADMDWRRFPKTRVCFFVDRDLSGLIPENRAADVNIYLTDGYSIENAIVGRGMCRRVLTELYGFGTVAHDELEAVVGLFERELEAFLKKMVPVMAWILAWRRLGSRANLNDIVMRDLFRLDKGCLQPASAPGGKVSVAEYLHERCRVAFDTSIDIRPIEAEFERKHSYRTLTRGKFVLWFMIEFCGSVHQNAACLFSAISKPPKVHSTISAANGMAVIGARARIPSSLKRFLESTFCAHITRAELSFARRA